MKLKRQLQDNNPGDCSATQGVDATDKDEPTEDNRAIVLSPSIGKLTRLIAGIEDKHKSLQIVA